MKSKKIILLLTGMILLVVSCSKDLGNYKYDEISSFKIEGLKSGRNETDRTYYLSFNDTLNLQPELIVSKGTFQEDKFDFVWEINGKKVSDKKDLTYLANQEFGMLKVLYKVKSKETGIERLHNFYVNISQPFKYGYFVLTQGADKSTHIYCKSSIKMNLPLQEIKISSLPDLGSEPVAFSGLQNGYDEKRYYNLILTSKKGKYPVIIFDSKTFDPIQLYNNENFVGDQTNFNFSPEYVRYDEYSPIVYAINQGKMHVLNKGVISVPLMANDAMNYAIGDHGLSSVLTVSRDLNIFFDKKNERMRAWATSGGTPYDFRKNFDQVLNSLDLSGHTYLCGQLTVLNNAIGFYFLTRKNNSLYSYRILFSGLTPSGYELIKEIPYDASVPISQVSYDVPSNNWYLASKKIIYRFSALGLDLQEYIKLPATAKGDIAKFHFARDYNRFMIGTIDKSISTGKNSSIYIYDTNTLTQSYKEELALDEIKDVYAGL